MTKLRILLLFTSLLATTHLFAQAPSNLTQYFTEHQLQPQQGIDGIYFQVDQQGNGQQPQAGDYVMLRYKAMLTDGTVFDQSEAGDPFVFQLGYRQVILGWEKGISYFTKGSKGKLFVPSALGYGSRGVGNRIPPNADLIYEIELLDIMDFEAYDRYMVELEKKERAAFEAKMKQQFIQDKKDIQTYTLDNKLKAKRLPSGLSYVLKKKGKGKTAQPGDQLKVQYEGRLLDNSVFDATKGREVFEFVLGRKKVIPGWDEGLQYFKKGAEGWLLIPSKMAYGPREIMEGDIQIPGNSVLIFKIKVVDIEEQATVKK